MSGQPARSGEAAPPRLVVLDGEVPHEVFDVLGVSDGVIRVRTAFLFEVGEELRVRLEQDGNTADTTARVRGHVGPEDAQITELELADRAVGGSIGSTGSTGSIGSTGPAGPAASGGPAEGR
ncbi:MAG TPA: hypothetical protein VFT22_27650 [Kofleriaceae bacterium]|nr:hypothetical protein [Kofleriaceae bacterium]